MIPKKPEFIMCSHCQKQIQKKSHNQKYCIPCVDAVAKIKRDRKKNPPVDPQKSERHEEYKRLLCNMLLNFYVDINNTSKILTPNQLTNFIVRWVEKQIKEPIENWNPLEDESE
jgi:hypothetical protein